MQTSPLQPSREKVAGAMRYAESTPWRANLIEVNAPPIEVRKTIRHWNPVGCIVERGLSSARVPKRLFAGIPVVYIDQVPHKGPEREWCVCHDSRASVRRAFAELEAGKPAGFAFVRDARRRKPPLHDASYRIPVPQDLSHLAMGRVHLYQIDVPRRALGIAHGARHLLAGRLQRRSL